jgi:hypothetical protein
MLDVSGVSCVHIDVSSVARNQNIFWMGVTVIWLTFWFTLAIGLISAQIYVGDMFGVYASDDEFLIAIKLLYLAFAAPIISWALCGLFTRLAIVGAGVLYATYLTVTIWYLYLAPGQRYKSVWATEDLNVGNYQPEVFYPLLLVHATMAVLLLTSIIWLSSFWLGKIPTLSRSFASVDKAVIRHSRLTLGRNVWRVYQRVIVALAVIGVLWLISSWLLSSFIVLTRWGQEIGGLFADALVPELQLIGYDTIPQIVLFFVSIAIVALAIGRLVIKSFTALQRLLRGLADRIKPGAINNDILLLRSFSDDDADVKALFVVDRWIGRRKRLEETLCDEMDRLGSLSAIGAPGEFAPQLGAHRRYYADQEWQSAILEQIGSSKLIVMIVGLTPAVKWELEQIIRNGALTKTMFFFPPQHVAERVKQLNEALTANGLREISDPPQGLRSAYLHDATYTLVASRRSDQCSYAMATIAALYSMISPNQKLS